MSARGAIYVIGDSHIGLSDGSETSILEWLDRLSERSPGALYLNGDLFHYLIAHRKFLTPAVEKVMAGFQKLRERGIGVHYVEGNRDFFLRGSFAERAVTDVGMEYSVQAGKRRFLIVHGDLINERDWPYRFWRFASKNPISRLGLELLPGRVARRFVEDVERKLAGSNFKHKSRLPLELMDRYASRRAKTGFTDVVFGHFHQKVVRDAGNATITILPPWFEQGEAMVIDPRTGATAFEVI